MSHLGDYDAAAVIYFHFTTYRPSTGAAYTLGGTPALSVYKDDGTTESTSGITLTADFDSRTGLNSVKIDTGADGTFYASGHFFSVVITTGTVDSVSVVGAVVATFSLRTNSSLKPATAGRTLVVDGSGLADANAVKVGPTGSGTAQTARDLGASVLLSSGTGTGQLDFTSGVVKSNATQIAGGTIPTPAVTGVPKVDLTYILGTLLTETAGLLAGGFKKLFNVASPTGTLNSLPDAVPGAAGGLLVDDVWTDARAAKLDNLDVAVSTRGTGDATAANQTTILNRLGAFTGSGINTVLGFFKALLRKDASAPSDVGGTFDPATDSTEAIAELEATIAGYIDTEVAAIKAKTDNLPAAPAAVSDIPTANQNADAILDRADAVETGWTLRKALRIISSAVGGKSSGHATGSPVYRSITDAKDRITATTDADGNRTAVTLDGT